MRYTTDLGDRYSPLYFLSALGAGGLSISFFMYLMWLTPHKDSPIPTFQTLLAAFNEGGTPMKALILAAIAGILFFAVLHIRLLVWNIRQYDRWKATPTAIALRTSNNESQLMALPLTFAMSINVGFILGAVFVPGLWDMREWLFPGAIVGFAITGFFAVRIYLDFMSRVLTRDGFACEANNSLGQMVSIFALSMVGVGFSAPAAMSHIKLVSAISFMAATFFIAAAVLLGLMKLILGFRAMMEHTVTEETTPTLWIIIPILTVVGIAIYRLKMAMAHNFGTEVSSGEIFAFLSTFFAIQLLFGLLGWAVMKRVGYFQRWISGPERSAGSYALICPGVALFVFLSFLINPGFVGIGIVTRMSAAYLLLYVPLIVIQALTIRLFLRLNGKLLKTPPAKPATGSMVAAE